MGVKRSKITTAEKQGVNSLEKKTLKIPRRSSMGKMIGEEITDQRKKERKGRSTKGQLCPKWPCTPGFPCLTLLAFWAD